MMKLSNEVQEGYLYSPAQTDKHRRSWIKEQLFPHLEKNVFEPMPNVKSVMLLVSQFYNDEADDQVHCSFLLSELDRPSFEGALYYSHSKGARDINLPSSPRSSIYLAFNTSADRKLWDGNYEAISLWSAFADEDEQSRPAAIVWRDGSFEILEMVRPNLDGIMPTFELR